MLTDFGSRVVLAIVAAVAVAVMGQAVIRGMSADDGIEVRVCQRVIDADGTYGYQCAR